MGRPHAPLAPLPGLVKLYLGSLYASVLFMAALAVYLGGILAGSLHAWIEDYVPLLCVLAVAGAGLWNIAAIHRRSGRAPAISQIILALCATLGGIAAVLIFLQALDQFTPFGGEYAPIWMALMQNLVLAVAWFLYWRRSPRASAAFGLPAPGRTSRAAPSLELMRLAAVYILVTGICYSLTFVLYHSGNLSAPGASPGHWALFGLPLTALLAHPDRAGQRTFDWLGRLLLLWMAVLAVLSLVHLWFPLSMELLPLLVYLPGTRLSLFVEAVVIIAMFWYVAWRSVGPEAGKTSAFWVRAARTARAAGIRGLDLLYMPLLVYVIGNLNPGYGPNLPHYVYIGTLGLGLIIALGILLARPSFFIAYMRYFSAGVPIVYLIRRFFEGLDGYGPFPDLLYAVDWSSVVYMVLGMAYFWMRESLTAHPARVFMRFTAWGCIALSLVMLIHAPAFFNTGEDQASTLWWAVHVGLPWLYFPFAAGLLYADRKRKGAASPLFTTSAIGLIAMLCAGTFLSLLAGYVQLLPLEQALDTTLEVYATIMPTGEGTAWALAICLWALGVSGREPETGA